MPKTVSRHSQHKQDTVDAKPDTLPDEREWPRMRQEHSLHLSLHAASGESSMAMSSLNPSFTP